MTGGPRQYAHVPHPHIQRRREDGPVRTGDVLPRGSPVARFNSRLAVLVTKGVGSMYCAYLFAGFDCLSAPASFREGIQGIVSWVAQVFLQLVLLSVIMVGQNIQAEAADCRSAQTYDDAEAILSESLQIQDHLKVQDRDMAEVLTEIRAGRQDMKAIIAAINAALPGGRSSGRRGG